MKTLFLLSEDEKIYLRVILRQQESGYLQGDENYLRKFDLTDEQVSNLYSLATKILEVDKL